MMSGQNSGQMAAAFEFRTSDQVPDEEVWLISIKDREPVVHKITGVEWDEESESLDTVV